MIRKILRSIARAKMEHDDIKNINRKRASGKSFFAEKWKTYEQSNKKVKKRNRK